MKTYQAVKAEIAKLEARAEALRKSELKSVIAQVRKTIAQYDLSAADLGLGRGAATRGRGRAAGKASVGVAKYRDPKTGQTWTGRGRPPAWIVDVKNREAFLIDGASAPVAAKKGRPARKAAAKGAAKKTAGRKAAGKARKTRAASKTPAVQVESGAAQ